MFDNLFAAIIAWFIGWLSAFFGDLTGMFGG